MKMKHKATFVLILFTLLVVLQGHAQWMQVGYMVTNGTDTADYDHGFNAFGTDVFSSTIDGLFRSSDNGQSWQNITDGKPNTTGHEFYTVYKRANNDLIAGSSLRLFKSTDDGATWTWLNTLPDNLNWWDVTESGGNLLASYIDGANSGVYTSADGGSSWTLATGISSAVRRFWVDGATVWLGGGANGVYKSTDDGASWATAGTGFPASAGIWSVIGSGGALFANSVTGLGLFVSRDNGATWANTDTTVFHDFCQVFSITAAGNQILASMDGACNGGASIKGSTDIGITWPAFMDSLPQSFYANIGRNAAGTSFFAKRGGFGGHEVYRYDLSATAVDPVMHSPLAGLYPNPTASGFQVDLRAAPSNATMLQVVDGMGRVVYEGQLRQQQNWIATDAWPRGLYGYRLLQGERLLQSGKLILQ